MQQLNMPLDATGLSIAPMDTTKQPTLDRDGAARGIKGHNGAAYHSLDHDGAAHRIKGHNGAAHRAAKLQATSSLILRNTY